MLEDIVQRKNMGKKGILLFLALDRIAKAYSEHGKEYVEKLTCILQKKEISYLDFFEEFPIPTTNAGDQYTIDGLHPNNYGHKIIADKIAMYIKEMF